MLLSNQIFIKELGLPMKTPTESREYWRWDCQSSPITDSSFCAEHTDKSTCTRCRENLPAVDGRCSTCIRAEQRQIMEYLANRYPQAKADTNKRGSGCCSYTQV